MHDGTQKVTKSAEICKNKKDFNVTALRDEKNLWIFFSLSGLVPGLLKFVFAWLMWKCREFNLFL